MNPHLVLLHIYLTAIAGTVYWSATLDHTWAKVAVLLLCFVAMLVVTRGFFLAVFIKGIDRGLSLTQYSQEWTAHMERQGKLYE